MRRLTTESDTLRGRRTSRLTSVSAIVSLMAMFAPAVTTIPLFNSYRSEDGIADATISVAVVTHSVAALSTLSLLGRPSNQVGRRIVAVASLALLVPSCLLQLRMHQIAILIAA